MTFHQELSSWFVPQPTTTTNPSSSPALGQLAPKTPNLDLSSPSEPTILVFLRHCGCPFAEKTFLNLRQAAKRHKSVAFTAISHSSAAATQTWLDSLPQAGSESANLEVLVDEGLEVYGAWGLGASSYAHVVSPWALYSVWRLGREEGIWNRPTESGSRWQMGGWFGVDGEGVVRWGRAARSADEIPNFEEGVEAIASVTPSSQAKL
ncbi:hypothetical protein LTR62_004431 [Meristemomyces frigidus]|uniref:Alkyl hydroperoxide reductase subunit C/ Thiol specific antioxidant domain-containing protein n=1 Tax=Meristemomyces frigidus TaxID=1508187 RepID=A0AAN7THX2_9PEZI|nr:hypothetical protein LTR62_004431 [Meristemomyces frigidus]